MKKLIYWSALSLFIFGCNPSGQPSDSDNTEKDKARQDSTAMAEETKAADTKPGLSTLWESDTVLTTNESVLYHADEDILFVSNIDGKPTDEDGEGFISKLSPAGKVVELKWAQGLDAPKGMGIYNDKLYVTNINELVAIDLNDPSQMQRYPVEGAQFLNDVAIGNGKVYFSDMKTGKLHVLENGKVSTMLKGHANINGLAVADGKVYALDGHGLHHIPLNGSAPKIINSQVTGGDGLVVLNASESKFLASRWQGEIWLVEGENASKLFDSKAEEIQTADIGYNAEAGVVYVPRFFSNKITAMQLDY